MPQLQFSCVDRLTVTLHVTAIVMQYTAAGVL